ncbi:MAG: master DNA invertase Mpi family serine-type recombinase [Oligosphaeraceae bacterium]
MNYGYIRVSTDKQTVENQRFELQRFCQENQCVIDVWVEETISGTKAPEKRKLGKVIRQMRKGDVLICAELSRLGRNLLMIMGILNQCMNKEVQVWTIKDNYRLGNDISSKVLAFAFGLSAEIERNLISQRTREALARRRAEGIHLGHRKGQKNSHTKLTGHEEEITALRQKHHTIASIARRLHVHPITIHRFLKERTRKEIAPPGTV